MVNKVIIVGNLGGDPELKYLPDGTAVATFSVATSERWTDKGSGEKRESTEWHRVVAWRQLAEIVAQHLSKGRQVYVEGALKTRSWEGDDGVKRYATEVQAREVKFLGAPKGNGVPHPAEQPVGAGVGGGDIDPTDIPF